jgi:6-phosphogluconolactonase
MQRNIVPAYPSLEMLSNVASERVIVLANEAIKRRGIFRIALAGGSTPRTLYEVLGSKKYSDQTDWSSWMIYFSDERVVPLTDERSNYSMARHTLLSNALIKEGNVYMPPVHMIDPTKVALEYETQIRRSFLDDDASIPRLDLVLLGLGSDGHTASLFPGKASLDAVNRLVVESTPGVLPPPVDRITFTLPFINAARHVMFLASGADKVDAFQAAYYGAALGLVQPVPAYLVRPEDGTSEWFITEEVSGRT